MQWTKTDNLIRSLMPKNTGEKMLPMIFIKKKLLIALIVVPILIPRMPHTLFFNRNSRCCWTSGNRIMCLPFQRVSAVKYRPVQNPKGPPILSGSSELVWWNSCCVRRTVHAPTKLWSPIKFQNLTESGFNNSCTLVLHISRFTEVIPAKDKVDRVKSNAAAPVKIQNWNDTTWANQIWKLSIGLVISRKQVARNAIEIRGQRTHCQKQLAPTRHR